MQNRFIACPEPRHLFKEWEQIPNGLCLIRRQHHESGNYCLHLHLKVNDGPWFDQPHTPAYSGGSYPLRYKEFWEWAAENLPTWDHPDII